ncbi:short-chain dehydrogenase/reductase [Reticulibacter mediterranei]|uniref:Short-chain dehydrogenase/reductase n=1 Tax=Reticulibacter mediterranei TaxID=2778369 RepID=A0A8J3N4M1_9CHLR|nr:oxidoreductase [Reticulibacter mediterranei]GHO95618.1 short-chain dehydrogenase/reductase [Reticulibacter mediterranei]
MSSQKKVWLITGSSRGFGRSLAEAVLAHGDQLVATARNPQQLYDLVERYGENVRTVELDVTKPEQARAAVAVAVDTFGRLDVVVNNAGYANVAAIEDATEEDMRAQIETDLWGVIHVTRAALPVLRKQRSGHFVQFSSVGGRVGTPGLAAYQTAKFGVEGFSEVLAREVEPLGIKVTIIEPGGFATDWAGSSMHTMEPSEDYQDTVGRLHNRFRQQGGVSAGDPAKAAQAIITIVNEEQPPLRLLLGSDALLVVRHADQVKLAEIDRWEHLSRSTNVDGLDVVEHEKQLRQALNI